MSKQAMEKKRKQNAKDSNEETTPTKLAKFVNSVKKTAADTSDWQSSDRMELRKNFKDTQYDGNVVELSETANRFYCEFRTGKRDFRDYLYHSPYMAVVQSSGTGKSRAVYELAKMRWVVYVCFRDASSSGFPLASPENVMHHLKISNTQDWFAFFAAVSAVMNLIARKDLNKAVNGCKQFFTDLFDDVEKKMGQKQSFDNNNEPFSTNQCKMFFDLLVLDFNREFVNSFWNVVLKVADLMQTALLAHFVPEICQWSADMPLLVAFDEAGALLENYNTIIKPTLFEEMLRGANILGRKSGLFCLLLDTNAKITNYPPMPEHDSSSRGISPGLSLFPPYVVRMPPEKIATGENFTLATWCTGKHLISLGRPLWTKGSFQNPEDNLNEVADFAEDKLGLPYEIRKPEDMKYEIAIALLAPRVGLIVSPSTHLPNELMARRLWYLTGISEDRDLLFGYYPSEPMVVAACFSKFQSLNGLSFALEKITSAFLKGYCNAGSVGEFIARLCFLMAVDSLFVKFGVPETFIPAKLFQTRVVSDFLGALVGGMKITELLEANPDDPDLATLLSGRIYFTHFARCLSVITQNPLIIWDLMRRGAGGYFPHSHPAIDLLIPIFLGNNDALVNHNLLTCLVIQVKNRNPPPDKSDIVKIHSACEKLLRKPVLLNKQEGRVVEDNNPVISVAFSVKSNGTRPEIVYDKSKKHLKITIFGVEELEFLKNYCYDSFRPDLVILAKSNIINDREEELLSMARVNGDAVQ